MAEFYAELLNVLLRLVVAGIGALTTVVILPWVKNELIPWLHEKRIYALVCKFVQAAEKMCEAGNLVGPKKDFVVELLADKGIFVTPEIDAFIESAVKELDIAIDSSIGGIAGEFEIALDKDELPFSELEEEVDLHE